MKLHISTPVGERYTILENGNIYRDDMEDFVPSGEWKMTGLSKTDLSFGRMAVGLADITPEWLRTHPLLYKNGSPRYTMMDIDHGTKRVTGNTKHHGVKSMYFEHSPADPDVADDIVEGHIESALEHLQSAGLAKKKGNKWYPTAKGKKVAKSRLKSRVLDELGGTK